MAPVWDNVAVDGGFVDRIEVVTVLDDQPVLHGGMNSTEQGRGPVCSAVFPAINPQEKLAIRRGWSDPCGDRTSG